MFLHCGKCVDRTWLGRERARALMKMCVVSVIALASARGGCRGDADGVGGFVRVRGAKERL